ncbi:S1 family peptidase [Alteromonas sp. A081]|uniref:S1 family peptidase n=1 Tax=Alteromonas sp. A081 TaxID=3410269 RepID=UPI003B97E6FE
MKKISCNIFTVSNIQMFNWLKHSIHSFALLLLSITILMASASSLASDQEQFPDVVSRVTKSTLAIAIDAPIKHAAPRVLGTGFVVDTGEYAITNYHVVSQVLDPTIVENYVVLSGEGTKVRKIKAEIVKIDPKHDLALLKLSETLEPSVLSSNELLPPGTDVAFTGFPIGAILGLYPATHRGYISAITPDAIPARNADELTIAMMKRLQSTSLIYQLDATAYPGNSGSPVYEPDTGNVVGVINKVLVKDTKESALSSPTGISYAVPIKYVRELLERER